LAMERNLFSVDRPTCSGKGDPNQSTGPGDNRAQHGTEERRSSPMNGRLQPNKKPSPAGAEEGKFGRKKR
jgi:hypothetical protein